MNNIIGADIGFGFTKAMGHNSSVVFKSIFGDAHDIQFWSDFGVDHEGVDLHVEFDGHAYFLGDLAALQSSVRHFTLDQEKMVNEFIRVLGVCAVAMLVPEDAPINTPLNLVSGLPVAYYQKNKETFEKAMCGHHEIKFMRPKQKAINKFVYINKVRLVPQPVGSFLHCIMDDQGQVGDTDLTRQKVGIIDIGFCTTDILIMNKMQYVERGSRSIDCGISKGFLMIADTLFEQWGVNIELYRLYKAVETGNIKVRGKSASLTELKIKTFTQLAETIAQQIDHLWVNDWDLDAIYLTGGGSMELAEYLKPLIGSGLRTIPQSDDSRFNNVRGYLKYGRYLWDAENGG